MSAEAQLQYESRVRNRQATIAIVAGLLVLAGSIVGLIGAWMAVVIVRARGLRAHIKGR